MSASWSFSLKIEFIPLNSFDKLLERIELLFRNNIYCLFKNEFENFDFIIANKNFENSTIEISELQIEGQYNFAHEALESFKKIIWEQDFIPFEFGAEVKEGILMVNHDLDDYREYKNCRRVLNLHKLSNIEDKLSLFSTEEILNYIKASHEIEIDKIIFESEISNYETLNCERLDPENHFYFMNIENKKKKISEQLNISLRSVERLTYLIDLFSYEYHNDLNFEFKDVRKLNDMPLFFSKHKDKNVGNFYLISNQPLLTSKV